MDLLNLCRKVKVYKILNCTEHLLILACTVIGCDSISTLASLVGIREVIASSAITTNISEITTDSNISLHEFVLVSNVLKEYDERRLQKL